MTIDLRDVAYAAMSSRGFIAEFPETVLKELTAIAVPAMPLDSVRDMRSLLWISIDNEDTLDLDQLTFAEKDKIYVAIADVDALVKKGSAIDHYAAYNTTSVYTPAKVFPMLPAKLSTDLTSLKEHADRCAIVVEIEVDQGGAFHLCNIYPAYVRNQAKLAFSLVALWLEKNIPLKQFFDIPELAEQLILQDALAQRIQAYRNNQGALHFVSPEIEPIMKDETAIGLKEKIYNRADALIENCMIAANVCVTRYLAEHNQPTLRRIVRTPKRWDRIVSLASSLGSKLPPEADVKALSLFLAEQQRKDPEHFAELSLVIIKLIGKGEYVVAAPGETGLGHFDLALRDYAHTTAPNRRFPDLVMQRLLKRSFSDNKQPYSHAELTAIALHCTAQEDAAVRVERHVRKAAAAMVIFPQIGQTFRAIVTGCDERGTWVRLLNMPIEGKLVEGAQGADVGDYLTVKLIDVDIPSGHIDFAG